MEAHMEIVRERAQAAYADTLDATVRIQVFGQPTEAILETLRQQAGSGVEMRVNGVHLGGFTRSVAISEIEAHLPAIGEDERTLAGHLLQSTLVELIVLALVGKQLHWNIVGHGFRDLHLQLDELVDEWQELADLVAERAMAMGYKVDGRAAVVAEQSE